MNQRSEWAPKAWPAFFSIQLIFLLVISLDQFSKIIAPKFLTIICNQGFGLGINFDGVASIFLASAVLVFLTFLLSREKNQLAALAIVLVMAGGVSNLLDRLLLGCVRDFIGLAGLGRWPAFNLADSAITLGAILLVFSIFFRKSDEGS